MRMLPWLRAAPSPAAAGYGLQQLHPECRLLTSDTLYLDFPGRVFQVDALHPPFKGDWLSVPRSSCAAIPKKPITYASA